jgi:hypothetical protein
VHFIAAGDFSASTNAASVLNAIDSADSVLTVALGDLSYGTTGQEQTWCGFVTRADRDRRRPAGGDRTLK